jgi:hypothetical protein
MAASGLPAAGTGTRGGGGLLSWHPANVPTIVPAEIATIVNQPNRRTEASLIVIKPYD